MDEFCYKEIIACISLSILYVSSLYIWNGSQERDHPSTIKKRSISVCFMTLISPLFLLYFISEENRQKVSLWKIMGLRLEGILPAVVLPMVLTFILFLGPIVQVHRCVPINITLSLYMQPKYWWNTFQNPIWWRNQVVAPFSEEFTFRVCMLPLLLQCLSPVVAIFVAPLFFGIAHLHHAVDRIKRGLPIVTVLLFSFFQFSYTSVFGFYSAFLFIRTGHFLPLFAVHSFCNHMGLPEIREILSSPEPIRTKLLLVHIFGLVAWYFLLYPLTEPSLYLNEFYKL